jgi:hypothetical protein
MAQLREWSLLGRAWTPYHIMATKFQWRQHKTAKKWSLIWTRWTPTHTLQQLLEELIQAITKLMHQHLKATLDIKHHRKRATTTRRKVPSLDIPSLINKNLLLSYRQSPRTALNVLGRQEAQKATTVLTPLHLSKLLLARVIQRRG